MCFHASKCNLALNDQNTYVVATFEGSVHVWIHVMVIKSHEECVYDNTKSNEQFDEWVENK